MNHRQLVANRFQNMILEIDRKQDEERTPDAGPHVSLNSGTPADVRQDLTADPGEDMGAESPRTARWAGRVGLVLDSPDLVFEVSRCFALGGVEIAFRMPPASAPFEVAGMVERERADLVFVELARVKGGASNWIQTVRGGTEAPLIVAMNLAPDPGVMIEAVRAGANEFLSLPAESAASASVASLETSLREALDRLTMVVEARRAAAQVRGHMAGILSAKGGCGATTVACHLAAAMAAQGGGRVLLADLDTQASAAHKVLRLRPQVGAEEAFAGVRRLNAACWPEFASPAGENLDLLAGWTPGGEGPPLGEPSRMESMFRFLSRNYAWVMADLGRNLNPAVWAFIQNLDELFVVTAPDVLALYQTRSILQTLSGRGFDKSRLHLILNRNHKAPRDFWIESIKKMFEMDVMAALPEDRQTMEKLPRDRFEFPASSPFGKAIGKLAGQLRQREAGKSEESARRSASGKASGKKDTGRKDTGRKTQ